MGVSNEISSNIMAAWMVIPLLQESRNCIRWNTFCVHVCERECLTQIQYGSLLIKITRKLRKTVNHLSNTLQWSVDDFWTTYKHEGYIQTWS